MASTKQDDDAVLAYTFGDGPIGISLVDVHGFGTVVDGVAPGSLADGQSVPTGAVVHAVQANWRSV